ncbi:Neuferricin [Lonchura striata]|uniref:Neuferricin n=1 Tax=Lonchura striata TaxID=40157 RepID=A0A218V1F1_9PASE|nr:Neuferricin [Lonchura striata domestica]
MWRGAAAALLGLAAACLLRRGFEPRARLLSAAELRRYRGAPGEPGLYLALLGRVFDVQRGRKHYGPGGAYSGFAGRDATRAFASGDFTPAGLVDTVSGLSPAELLSIHSWLSFYSDNYEPVGKLVGRFYDENGAPTEALREVEAAIEQALKLQAQSDQKKQQFPPCNSEWSSAKGTRFWCSRESVLLGLNCNRVSLSVPSGGVPRAWAGVPRQLHRPGSQGARCVCVRSSGPPWGQPGSSQHSDRGDLDNPHLQQYEGCHPLAEQCVLLTG